MNPCPRRLFPSLDCKLASKTRNRWGLGGLQSSLSNCYENQATNPCPPHLFPTLDCRALASKDALSVSKWNSVDFHYYSPCTHFALAYNESCRVCNASLEIGGRQGGDSTLRYLIAIKTRQRTPAHPTYFLPHMSRLRASQASQSRACFPRPCVSWPAAPA